jgi:putative MATE family efflux protein
MGSMSKQPVDKTTRMGNAPILPLLLKMSGPAVLSMLIASMYNIVDSIFVSMVAEEAMRAVSIIFPVAQLMVAFGVGTSVGVNSYVARSLGAGNERSASKAATHGFVLSFINTALFMGVGYFVAPAVAHAFTDHPGVAADSIAYLRIVTVGSLGLFWQLHCEKIFQATGHMTRAMAIQILGAVLNIVLDPIMIFGHLGFPAMGVAGAAVATIVSQWIAGAVAVYLLFKKETTVTVRLGGFRFEPKILRSIYRVGLPSLVMMSVTSLVGLAFNAIIKPFSEMAITVMGVYMKLESFVFMPVFGMGQGMLPLMAYNYGADRYDRVRETLKKGLAVTLIIMATATVIFQCFPDALLSIFSATDALRAMGIPALRRISLCFVFAGVSIMLSNAFQALGRGEFSLFVSLFRQLVLLLPLARLFASRHLDDVWYAYVISDAGAMFVSIALYVWIRRRVIPTSSRSA